MDIKSNGFTVVELLVVISIISLLASVVLSNLSTSRIKANEAKFLAQGKQLINAIENFYLDNGEYPASNGCWYYGNPTPGCKPEAPTYSGGGYYGFLNFGCSPDDPLNNLEGQLIPKYISDSVRQSGNCFRYFNGRSIMRVSSNYTEKDPDREYVLMHLDYSSDISGSQNPCLGNDNVFKPYSSLDSDHYCWVRSR